MYKKINVIGICIFFIYLWFIVLLSMRLNMFMLGCEVIIFLDVMYEMFFDIKDILVS